MADAAALTDPADGRPLAVRRLALTWSIPDGFGGMTSAMLHRSRALAAATGDVVDVLTFDPRPGYDEIRSRLTALGELGDGVRLRNLYEELATLAGCEPAVDVREIHGADGEVARVEHLRADGSLAVLDERMDAHSDAAASSHADTRSTRRRLTAFDAEGAVVGRWPGAWACYAEWIDRIVADVPAVAVVDSKTMAPFVASLRRPNLATVHVVHASHLSGAARPFAPLRASRATALARMERFDAVVFLTERQRDDAVRLLGDPGNLAVIPNGRALPDDRGDGDGTRSGGVVVAGLTTRKRVADAIEIAALASLDGAGRIGGRLTIVGDGPDRERLEQLAADADCEVAFTGYRADGAEAFAEASWMLLTSRSEGSPLVLAEAMARGCVPIAYDVPYGPADLIEHGVNGFLVADGDREAAAEAISSLVRGTPTECAAMREAARRSAEQFDDRAVVAAWLELEREALAHASAHAGSPSDGELGRVRLRLRRGTLRLTARIAGAAPGSDVTASFRAAGTTRVVRRQVRLARAGRLRVRIGAEPSALLTDRGAIVVTLHLGAGRATTDLSPARLHPDRRSLPRRLRDRLRR